MHPKIHNFVLDASEKNTSPTQSFHYSQKHQHVRPLARGTKPLFTEKQKEKLNMSAFVSTPHMASPSTVRNVHDGLYWLSTFDYIQLHIKIMINKPEPRTRSKRFCLRCLKKILNTSANSTIQVSTKNYCMIARESDCLERISGSKRTTAAEIPDRADSCVTGCALSVLPEGHPVQRAVLCPVQKKKASGE